MNTKRLLIGLPLLTLALLVQSVFWIPSQKRQAVGNPQRLEQYYDGSIADAAILNPILNADSASSSLCDKIFDGLLDYDENLKHRGRLSTSWKISEEAYLWAEHNAADLKARIEQAIARSPQQSILRKIEKIQIDSPRQETRKLPPELAQEDLREVLVKIPARLHLTLSSVEQDLFKELEKALGDSPFHSINTSKAILGVQPQIAEKIAKAVLPAAEHNPVITFTLRQGVTFHDGHAFSAEDVKFTFDAIMSEKNLSPRLSDYEPVKELVVLDPNHVRIVYKRLYSPAIGTWAMGILPKHLLKDEVLQAEAKRKGKDPGTFSLRDTDFNRNPVGTGAFQFSEWRSDQYIKLKRNELYWDDVPKYREFIFRVLPEALAEEMEFYAGTLDGYNPRPFQVARLKNHPDYQSFSGLSYSYDYIGYNLRRELFQDLRVRKALGMAIDIQAITRYLYYGHAERITGPFLKQTPYYNQALNPLPYDPQGALRLLEEAGYEKNEKGTLVNRKTGEPLRFTLITNNGNELRKGIMTVAQQSWAKLGIEVAIQSIEWTVFLQKHVDQGNFDALVLGWKMGIDPDLYQIWHSSQIGPQQLNFVGYVNPKADELIVRIRQEYNQEKLIEACHQLHQVIYEDQPYTFLVAGRWTALLDKNIVRRIKVGDREQDLKITPTKTGDYNFYFNQWIKADKPALAKTLSP